MLELSPLKGSCPVHRNFPPEAFTATSLCILGTSHSTQTQSKFGMTYIFLHQETLGWNPNFIMRLGIKHILSMSLSQAYWVGNLPSPILPFWEDDQFLGGPVGSVIWFKHDWINPNFVVQGRLFFPFMRSKTTITSAPVSNSLYFWYRWRVWLWLRRKNPRQYQTLITLSDSFSAVFS